MGVVSGRLIIESALSCRGAFSMVFPLWEKNSHLRPRLFLRRRGIPCQYRAVSCDVTSHMRIVVSHVSVQLKSIIVGANMVLCIMIGCSKRSGRDKDVSFYRIPSVLTRNAAIVLIYKKGGKIDCTNYRGISLMSTVERRLSERQLYESLIIRTSSQDADSAKNGRQPTEENCTKCRQEA